MKGSLINAGQVGYRYKWIWLMTNLALRSWQARVGSIVSVPPESGDWLCLLSSAHLQMASSSSVPLLKPSRLLPAWESGSSLLPVPVGKKSSPHRCQSLTVPGFTSSHNDQEWQHPSSCHQWVESGPQSHDTIKVKPQTDPWYISKLCAILLCIWPFC